jgi:Ran GTPase-activating protein (RanGAP) involved in mRNA processing and transport
LKQINIIKRCNFPEFIFNLQDYSLKKNYTKQVKGIITLFVFAGLLLGMLFPEPQFLYRIINDSEKISADSGFDNVDDSAADNEESDNDNEKDSDEEKDGEEEEEKSEESEKDPKEYLASESLIVEFSNSVKSFFAKHKTGFSDHFLEIISPPPQV